VSGEREAVAAALAEHRGQVGGGGGLWNAKCLGCGMVATGAGTMLDAVDAHDAHVADAILAALPARLAELERDLAAARSALAAVREVRSSALAARAVADRDAARIAGQVRASGEGREA
jgi:hypothetical protein